MRSFVPLLALLSCTTPPPPVAKPPPARAPQPGPETAVETYFRASDNGSSRILRDAFHPDATMQWIDDSGAPQRVTQLAWWQRLDGTTHPKPADHRRWEVLDREGPFVLFEAVSRWPTHTFDDLLLVIQTGDGWRIVGKVFERIAPGAAMPGGTPEDDAAIRATITVKLDAHVGYDPILLARSHTADCMYAQVGFGGIPLEMTTLSWGAAEYARRREAGDSGAASKWRVLDVWIRGHTAAAKLDVIYQGRRYIDHLLFLRTPDGWRIAAAAWGDPTWSPAP